MTTAPMPPRLLSIDDWDALPEDNTAHLELQEGVLIVSPRPLRRHARAALAIASQLRDQLPSDLEALFEFEVCVDHSDPPTVRVPDVVVTHRDGSERRLDGPDVMVAIEVISPGSRRTDTVMKRSEYADAGIEHYWIVDIGDATTLTALHLAGEFGYQESPTVTGIFTTTAPVPLRIDLDDLTR